MTKLWIALILTIATASAQAPPPPKGSISGVVRDAGTGAPIAGADMYVNRNSAAEVSAVTDSEGRYTLRGLDPGRLRVSANGKGPGGITGFGANAARIVSLIGGQDLTAVDFHLRTHAEISGKVVDQNKEPIPGIRVFLVAREYFRGTLRYVYAGAASTDDQGAYVLSRVEPGRAYLVLAEKRALKLDPVSGAPAEPRLRRQAMVPTYYPGSKFVEGAQAFVLRVGERREGADIQMLRSPSYCVEGVLENANGPAPLRFNIDTLQPTSGQSGGGGFYMASPGGVAAADGKFRICDLAPGEYQLTAIQESTDAQGAPPFFGTTLVTIVDDDVRRVNAPARARLPVSGEVVWSGAPPDRPVEAKLIFFLQPMTRAPFRGETYDARPSIPGQFQLPGLMIDSYSIQIRGIPAGIYVKDITYGDRSILFEPLRVGSAAGDAVLRVILDRNGGNVSAKVADKDNNPISDAYVVILPAGAASEGVLAAAMVSGQTDQNGTWISESLAPGKYYAVASESAFDLTPESIGKLWRARTLAQEIELAPNAKVSITLTPKTLD